MDSLLWQKRIFKSRARFAAMKSECNVIDLSLNIILLVFLVCYRDRALISIFLDYIGKPVQIGINAPDTE